MASTKLTSQDRRELDKFTKYLVYKCIQVIVQSRLGEKVRTASKPHSSGSDWFNLSMKDLPEVNNEAKKVFPGPSLCIGQSVCVEMSLRTAEGESMVLETWNIAMVDQYDTNTRISYPLYSRMGILLKSLICVCRVSPAYRLSRKQGVDTFVICYRIYSGDPQVQHLGGGYKVANVGTVRTPLGAINVNLQYRTKMLISPQVSRDLYADLKDDHFCTDAMPRRMTSKPCQVIFRDGRNINGVEDRLSVGSSDSTECCNTTFSTSPLDSSPMHHFNGTFAGTTPPHRNGLKARSNEGNGTLFGTPEKYDSIMKSPKYGAFAAIKDQQESKSDEDIPFGTLLQQPAEKMEGTSSSGASVSAPSDVDSADGAVDMDPSTRSTASSNKSATSPQHTGSPMPHANPPASLPEDYVMVELKTPFAGSEGNTDLGHFFRECQGAPALNMFEDEETIQETLNSITDQLATFEMNASQFDEFLNSLQDIDDCT